MPAVLSDVAVVMVNYRNAPDTMEALDSLTAARPEPGAIVVVDNASGDESVRELERWARGAAVPLKRLGDGELAAAVPGSEGAALYLVITPTNLGFGGGVNAGVAALDATFSTIVLLNNDATVEPGFLQPVLEALADSPGAGLAGGTIRYAPPRQGEWFAGGELVWLQARGRHLHLPSDRISTMSFCTGCYMAVRREAFEAAGRMPECYFLYQEDVEFSARLRRAGYHMLHVPASVVYHKVSATAGSRRLRPASAFLASRNRLWFARRNLTGPRRAVAMAWVVGDEVNRALSAALRGASSVSLSILRGIWHGLFRKWPDRGPARP